MNRCHVYLSSVPYILHHRHCLFVCCCAAVFRAFCNDNFQFSTMLRLDAHRRVKRARRPGSSLHGGATIYIARHQFPHNGQHRQFRSEAHRLIWSVRYPPARRCRLFSIRSFWESIGPSIWSETGYIFYSLYTKRGYWKRWQCLWFSGRQYCCKSAFVRMFTPHSYCAGEVNGDGGKIQILPPKIIGVGMQSGADT